MSEIIQSQGFLTVEDIMDLLHVKEAKAYNIIRQLNKELSEKGFITIRGRVDANYFRKRMYYTE